MLIALLASSALAAPVTYTVDNDRSHLFAVVELSPDVMAEATGSTRHAVRAGVVNGKIGVEGSRLETAEVTANVRGMFPQEGDLLYAVAGKYDLTEGAVAFTKDCIQHYLGPKEHPDVSFTATSVRGLLPIVTVTGEFSLAGVTKTITVPLDIRAEDQDLHATGTFRVFLPDYGMAVPKAAYSLHQQVDIVIDLVLTP